MDREVYFDLYCKDCINSELSPDESDTCNECLTEPSNDDSHRPVNFKQK